MKLIKCEAQKLTDHYIAKLEKYCTLKAIDDSWTMSLSEELRSDMHQLRNFLGLDKNMKIPHVNSITGKVKQISEKIVIIFDSKVKTLVHALGEMDIEKMRQLQRNINIMELSTFLQKLLERIKSEKINSSEVQGGVLYQISVVFSDYFIPTISKIAVSVATNVITNIIL